MRRNWLLVVATIVLLPAPPAWAQGLTGALVGTVKDEQGGVLPGALVHISSPSLIGGELTTTTNEKGQLRFPVLAPGTYRLLVELPPRFASYREENIVIGAAATLERTSAKLQRQLSDVRARVAAIPRTSDVSRVLEALREVATGDDMPAALLADNRAQYIAVNDAACALTERTREELLSLHVWDLTPKDAVADGRQAWARFVESGTLAGPYVLTAPSGKQIAAHFVASTDILPGCHLSLLWSIPPALLPDSRG